MEFDKRTILVVDDEKALRIGVAAVVRAAGFQAVEAASGEEALELVRRRKPALIVLDVMMPGISGLEVCRILRDDPETSGIKIIILSAKGQIREQEEGLKAGADHYISKPFDYKELIETFKELLGS